MTTIPQTLDALLVKCAGAVYSSDEGPHSYVLPDEVRLPCECILGTQRCIGCRLGDAQVIAILGPDAPLAHPDEFCDPPCLNCQGRSWVPNPDGYAWRRAWWAIEGGLDIQALPYVTGDFVTAHGPWGQGTVHSKEGLRDQLAEMTAIERAIRQLPGVEMGA